MIKKDVLRVEVSSIDVGQLLGVARPDLFIRTPDRPFWSGYYKSILGIWLMLMLIVMLGVTASCFVTGPVASFLTFTFVVVGQWFRPFMEQMIAGKLEGGGVLESIVRILRHMNFSTPLEEGIATTVMRFIDETLNGMLWLVFHVIPNFVPFSRMSQYLPNGFDVDFGTALLPAIATTVAYLLPCLLLGYFSLKMRELEAK